MSTPSTKSPQRPRARVNDKKNQRVSFSKELESGEVLTGTPTAVEQTTSDLTITRVLVTTAALTIKGVSTPLGEAVTFHVTGFKAGITYEILVTVVTDASPDAQTLNRIITIVTD